MGMRGSQRGTRTWTVKCLICWLRACGAMISMLIMEYLEPVYPVRNSTGQWNRSRRVTRW